jgi:membrane protease YdiL (CAAX protease family)
MYELYSLRPDDAVIVGSVTFTPPAAWLPPSPNQPVRKPGYVPPASARWGLPDAATAIAAFVLLLVIARIVQQLLAETRIDQQLFTFVFALVAYGSMVGVLVFAAVKRGAGGFLADFGFSFRWVDLAIGLGIAVAARLFTALFAVVTAISTGHVPTSGNFVIAPQPLWVILNGLLVGVLLAPFVEELVMRGLLLRSIRNAFLRRRGSDRPVGARRRAWATPAAILISSAVFMALHLHESMDATLLIVLALSTFTIGALNAVITIVTGRLGAAIVAHVVFNGSSLLLQWLLLPS